MPSTTCSSGFAFPPGEPQREDSSPPTCLGAYSREGWGPADAAAVAPLPNLDGHVRQGDALLDPYTAATALAGNAPMPAARAELARAAAARRALYALTGPRKRDAIRELAAGEAQLARRLIDYGVERLEARIAELLAAAKTRDLFGRRPGFDSDQRLRLSRLRAALRDLRDARRRLARDGGAPFFAFESHLGDLLARRGVARGVR